MKEELVLKAKWVNKEKFVILMSGGCELSYIRRSYNNKYTVMRILHKDINIGNFSLNEAKEYVEKQLDSKKCVCNSKVHKLDKRFKISEIISKISRDGEYNSLLARKLYEEGVDYKSIELAVWIGAIKKKFEVVEGYEESGYCFQFNSECKACPLYNNVKNFNGSFDCSDCKSPLDTLKEIVKVMRKTA